MTAVLPVNCPWEGEQSLWAGGEPVRGVLGSEVINRGQSAGRGPCQAEGQGRPAASTLGPTARSPARWRRAPPFLGKGISKSKPHGPWLFLFITHVTVAQGAGGACGWQFSVPRGPPRLELCHYGQGAPPLWGRCSCGQNRGRRHLCCSWEGASTQPHTYRVIQNAASLPPVSPAPVLWVSCESPCIFAFAFFFFHCTAA